MEFVLKLLKKLQQLLNRPVFVSRPRADASKREKPKISLVVIGSHDLIFSNKIAEIVAANGYKIIRTNKIERVSKELKLPERLAIIDLNWEDVQAQGVLRQLVNIGKITANKVICMCPDREEQLKSLAKNSGPYKTFIRYDLFTAFKDEIAEL